MEIFYIILALYFALIFIHGAYMVGLEIGREKAFFPKMNLKFSIDGTDAITKFDRVSEALNKFIDRQNDEKNKREKIQRITLFSPGSPFYFGYPFKFEPGGKIE